MRESDATTLPTSGMKAPVLPSSSGGEGEALRKGTGERMLAGCWSVVLHAVAASYLILTVLPIFWLLYSSLKSNRDIVRNIFALPKEFYWGNYRQAWSLVNFSTLIGNSLVYTLSSVLVSTTFALMLAYAITRFPRFSRLSNAIYAFFALGLLLALQSLVVPLFLLENRMGLYDTRLGIILPYIALSLPFALYQAVSFVRGIPRSLDESAFLDGASHSRIFFSLIVPLSRPILATMSIFTFLGNWNDFMLVLVLTSSKTLHSIPVGVKAFVGGFTRDMGLLMAALSIATIPMLVFYFFFHRKIMQGFAGGAIKG